MDYLRMLLLLAWAVCFHGFAQAAAATSFTARPGDDLIALRNRVRAERAKDATVTVTLAPGRYEIAKPLEFGAADGNALWRSTGGRAELTGAIELKGWTTNTVNGVACWSVAAPAVLKGKPVTQLFVNGLRRLRAHLPHDGFYRFLGSPKEEMAQPGADECFYGAMSAIAAPGQFANYHDFSNIEVFVPNYWFDNHLRVKSFDEATRIVRFETRGMTRFWSDETGRPSRYRINNVKEGCTESGDWYYDRVSGVIFYIPYPDEELAAVKITVPLAERLLVVNGARDLRFGFLDLSGMDWELPRDNGGFGQAQPQVPAAVDFRGAKNCSLYGCHVHGVAGAGVAFDKDSRDCTVDSCSLRDFGAGGVLIRGDGITVANSAIFDGGLIFWGACGVWAGDVERTRLVGNRIHDFYYTGISVGWTWGYADCHARLNLIEGNRVEHIGKGMLSDMGGIYLLGRQPGTVVRRNYVADVSSFGYGGQGIYPDEGSSWMVIESNVVVNTKSECFFQHYGRGNLVRGNVLAGSQLALVHAQIGEICDQFVFRDNTLLDSVTPDGWKDNSMKPWPQGRPCCIEEGTRLGGVTGEFREGWLKMDDAVLASATAPCCRTRVLPPDDGPTRAPALFEPMLWPWAKGKGPKSLAKLFGPIAVTADVPKAVSLALVNRGDQPGTGVIRFRIEPAGAATCDLPAERTVTLAPGETLDLAGTVTAKGPGGFSLRMECPFTPVGTALHYESTSGVSP